MKVKQQGSQLSGSIDRGALRDRASYGVFLPIECDRLPLQHFRKPGFTPFTKLAAPPDFALSGGPGVLVQRCCNITGSKRHDRTRQFVETERRTLCSYASSKSERARLSLWSRRRFLNSRELLASAPSNEVRIGTISTDQAIFYSLYPRLRVACLLNFLCWDAPPGLVSGQGVTRVVGPAGDELSSQIRRALCFVAGLKQQTPDNRMIHAEDVYRGGFDPRPFRASPSNFAIGNAPKTRVTVKAKSRKHNGILDLLVRPMESYC